MSKKVYATFHESAGDNKDDVWTISEDSNETGWETDSGCAGYGLSKEKAEYYAKCINEYPRLLSIIEQAEKALQYYANLNQNAYHDAMEGELYSDWWARQSIVAIEALRAIQGEG